STNGTSSTPIRDKSPVKRGNYVSYPAKRSYIPERNVVVPELNGNHGKKTHMADQQSATQLHPQQRLETSNFKFHQHYNFCEKAKSSKQKTACERQ
ncbi:Hypothetical predicted protein, partial [Paramuricea clavata]